VADMKSEINALVEQVRREAASDAKATAAAHNAKVQAKINAANAALARIAAKYGKKAPGKFKADFIGGNSADYRIQSANYFG
jgi:hypothetical protein